MALKQPRIKRGRPVKLKTLMRRYDLECVTAICEYVEKPKSTIYRWEKEQPHFLELVVIGYAKKAGKI